ncbi:MAG: hypothetical protein ACR2QB_02855 [Gammaproteobacteria bacterium]
MDENGGTGRPEPELRAQRPWSRRAQAIAAVLWPSFLAAAFATMLFFSFVDPGDMEHAMRLPMEHTRMTGYGLGFFFFWVITVISSAVSVYLLRTARRNNRHNNGKG